jgi:hypothetical protein
VAAHKLLRLILCLNFENIVEDFTAEKSGGKRNYIWVGLIFLKKLNKRNLTA